MRRSLPPHAPSAPTAPRKRWSVGSNRLPFRDTAGSIFVTFAAQLAMVVSGVLSARMLGVGDRGRLALLVLFATIITQLGSLGMPLAVTYWVAREPSTARRLVRGLGLFVWRQVPALILIQAVILFVAFGGTAHYERTAAVISLLATPPTIGWWYWLAMLQGQRRFTAWNACRLLLPLGYAIVIAGLYAGHVRSLTTVVIAWTALLWLAAGSTMWVAARGGTTRTAGADRRPLPEQGAMLRFGLKALLGSVSPLQSFNLDQAVVGLFISPFALGIYVVAVSFTNLPFFVGFSVGSVAYPNIAADPDRKHVRKAIVVSALTVLVLTGILIIALELTVSWLIPRLFGAAFTPSVAVARILLLYALLVALRRVLGDCARGAGNPGLSTLEEMVALVCLVPAVALLIDHGVKGVAVAMVVSAAAGLATVVVGLVVATGPPNSRWRRRFYGSSGDGDQGSPIHPAPAIPSPVPPPAERWVAGRKP